MKKLIVLGWGLIFLISILLTACAATPKITSVQVDTSPGCECTVFFAEWSTDIPTTADVIVCSEETGACTDFPTDDCALVHCFTVQLNPMGHYKITLVASSCGKQDIYEILVDKGQIKR